MAEYSKYLFIFLQTLIYKHVVYLRPKLPKSMRLRGHKKSPAKEHKLQLNMMKWSDLVAYTFLVQKDMNHVVLIISYVEDQVDKVIQENLDSIFHFKMI